MAIKHCFGLWQPQCEVFYNDRPVQNEFQNKLKEDIKLINNESKTLTFVSKTKNLYNLEKEEHKKLLKDSITTTYKKVIKKKTKNKNKTTVNKLTLRGKNFVKDKTFANRILVNGHNECFTSLKDHKSNFTNNPKTRLINPIKSKIGRLSKSILDKINNKLKNTISLMERHFKSH